jgi:SAM-dependent methyltransferase
MTQQLDPQAVKDQQRKDWGEAAPGWSKHDDRLRRITAPVTERLLALARIAPGQRVLDIASGGGQPALSIAELVGPSGSVLATDMAPEMLEVAREKAQGQGLTNVEFRLVDGEELDVEPNSFDAVTCRWGIMFMPEPVRCLKQAHRALKPGGRIAVAVWGPPDRNAWVTIPMAILRRHANVPPPDPSAPGVFAFADRSRLNFTFTQAGFNDTLIEDIELPMSEFDSGHDYWRYTQEVVGPVRALFEKLPPALQETAALEIAAAAAGGGDPNGPVSLRGNPLFASATK